MRRPVRPGLLLTQNEVRLPYPALSDEEVAALTARLGSDHRWLWGQPEPIRQMLHLPLFLIVATLRQQAGAEIPRSQGTFLDALAKAALDRGHQPTDQARQALQSLARLTTESGGAVPAAELGSDQAVRAVLETRLVVREGRSVRFALPVVEQYFAAQPLLENGLDGLDLGDLSLLDRWRDTLTLAVTIGSWPQASDLLDNLSARYPGLAASIVANAVPHATTAPSTGLPSHAECARRIRHALATSLAGSVPLADTSTSRTARGGSSRWARLPTAGSQRAFACAPTPAPIPCGFRPWTDRTPAADGSD